MSSIDQSQNIPVSGQRKTLRLWPGYVMGGLVILLVFIVPVFVANMKMLSVIGGLLGGVLIVIWWLFFSRAKMAERLLLLPVLIVAMLGAFLFLDPSIKTGNMGLMFMMSAIPLLGIAVVVWAALTQRLSDTIRRISLIAVIILFSGMWCFLRSDGIDGYGNAYFAWRWSPTAEKKFLAKTADDAFVSPSENSSGADSNFWPGFRGENRDSIVYGNQISTDWKLNPPVELWRHNVGPGCSSFAIKGNLIYTQEQIGEIETVSCYALDTGLPVWKHGDKARFWDSHAGAGPRSTPTLSGEFVYTLGATGIVNKLNATDGSVIWTRNTANDTGIKPLEWAFTASPLVVEGAVMIALNGTLIAFNSETGELLWKGDDCGDSYSSPQVFTIDGVDQVLFLGQDAVISVDPKNGKQNWKYARSMETRILQPGQIMDGNFLISGDGLTTVSQVSITQNQNQWSISETWTSKDMKLNFYDFIINKGYVYGFDGQNIACLDIKTGKAKWYGDRLGGFSLLLAEQDLLLVLTEKGEVALVKASPEKYKLLSKIKVLKSRVWNHPAIAGNILLVRNANEMAAYRLPSL